MVDGLSFRRSYKPFSQTPCCIFPGAHVCTCSHSTVVGTARTASPDTRSVRTEQSVRSMTCRTRSFTGSCVPRERLSLREVMFSRTTVTADQQVAQLLSNAGIHAWQLSGLSTQTGQASWHAYCAWRFHEVNTHAHSGWFKLCIKPAVQHLRTEPYFGTSNFCCCGHSENGTRLTLRFPECL